MLQDFVLKSIRIHFSSGKYNWFCRIKIDLDVHERKRFLSVSRVFNPFETRSGEQGSRGDLSQRIFKLRRYREIAFEPRHVVDAIGALVGEEVLPLLWGNEEVNVSL